MVRDQGTIKQSRGVLSNGSQPNTQSVFGTQSRYSLKDYKLPLVTTKKMGTKGFITELIWFLRGESNTKFLEDNGCTIWREWCDENGELGPIYGCTWRNFNNEGIDQIKILQRDLLSNPSSRRHILTAWNPAQIHNMALPPCHCFAQFYVDNEKRLSCQMYQRSADLFLGVPWNVASYSLLTMMLARVLNYEPHEFIHTIGDAHIYENHFKQVDEQITRQPFDSPQVYFPKKDSILQYQIDDFKIINYQSHPKLDGEVAV